MELDATSSYAGQAGRKVLKKQPVGSLQRQPGSMLAVIARAPTAQLAKLNERTENVYENKGGAGSVDSRFWGATFSRAIGPT